MSSPFARHRILYSGHLLHFEPARLPGHRFRARVTITALEGDYTIAQRFFDFEEFDSEEEAVEYGRSEGMAWVDLQVAATRSRPRQEVDTVM